jgi:hypothetical protein
MRSGFGSAESPTRCSSRLAAFRCLCAALSGLPQEGLKTRLHKFIDASDFSWVKFVDLATDQLMAPALGERLGRVGLRDQLPDSVDRYLQSMLRLNRARNLRIADEAVEIAAALNETGIVPLFFKGGGALLTGVYDDPGMRVMSDLDVLVPQPCSEDAIRRFGELGYARDSTPRHPRDQSYAVFASASRVAAIDLHRDAIVYPFETLLPSNEIIAGSVECRRGKAAFAVPSATHQVILNIAHAQLHHNRNYIYGRIMLRSLFDLVLLAEKFVGHIDWREVEDRYAAAECRTALEFQYLSAKELLGFTPPGQLHIGIAARLLLRRALFLTGNVAVHRLSDRVMRVTVLLWRELSDRELRSRLRRNLADAKWWRRHLAVLWRGGAAAAP